MASDQDTYVQANYNFMTSNVNALNSTLTDIRVALLSSAYTADVQNDDNWGEISSLEITGNNYSSPGAELTTKSVTASGQEVVFNADDVTWSNSSITAYYAVVFDNTSTAAANKKLLSYTDFGGAKIADGGDFTIQWSTAGIFSITAST